MMKFVTIFGTDPEKIAEPEPLKAPPAHIQIVDKDGVIAASYDTQADYDEVVANMKERNSELPDDAQQPIPTAEQSYQSLLYRCKLDVEMHNGQFPDDPWTLQEEQDVPDPVIATPASDTVATPAAKE